MAANLPNPKAVAGAFRNAQVDVVATDAELQASCAFLQPPKAP